jgi:hypothetical protein
MQRATLNQKKKLKHILGPWWFECGTLYDDAPSSFDVHN